ncbi:hypothetical protein LJC19_06665 [Oxalobacter sp. OttesenSCG-928-P03]|nr:hypothetical protein [Oxalobacter sp. OttesenSCG-928-P03]
MFSFFRKKEKKPEIPEWASFFTQEEYTAFLAGVDQYFRDMAVTYTLEDGIIEVDPNEFRFSKLGLSNVAQLCKQDSPENYAKIITEHFTAMLRALEFDRAFDEDVADFEKVRQYLGVRLYNQEYMTYIGGLDDEDGVVVERYEAEDVFAVLVFDLPDAIRNVSPSHVADWGISEDELFRIGIANIRENYPMNITQEDMGEFNIWFVNNNHFFTANIIYELNDRPELIGSRGSLIGLPHRHSALIYPIEDLGVVAAIQGMVPALYSMNQEGPGPLTPNLFWYRDGVLTHLPHEVRDEKLHFLPPDSFMAMLGEMENRLH